MEIRVEEPRFAEVPPDKKLVMLKEKDGARVVVINFNDIPFHLLGFELENIEHRPEIFKFIPESLLPALRANIEKVVIYDIVEKVFRSRIFVKDDRENRTYGLELHITVALTLAIAAQCPIFVTEGTFEKYSEHKMEARKLAWETGDAQYKKILEEIDSDQSTKH